VIKHLPSVTNEESAERQGDRGDVEVLVAHLGAAYNLARWLMRNQTEAEDVVQDAYLRAISHFAGFRGGDGRAWLLTIVRHTCYDRLKQKATSRQNTGFDEALHSADRQLPDPETAVLLAERTELLRESLAELPAEYREVFVLRELEQLSYREIATIAGIPLGTVMSRLSRARQQLQQTLDFMEKKQLTWLSFPSCPHITRLQRNISQPAWVSKCRTYDEEYTQPNDDRRT
jgi:RNA polymerase sigma-70 factor (ECF subfamily)